MVVLCLPLVGALSARDLNTALASTSTGISTSTPTSTSTGTPTGTAPSTAEDVVDWLENWVQTKMTGKDCEQTNAHHPLQSSG